MQNDAIQGTIKVVDADFFAAKLNVGSIYHISKFYIAYSKKQYRVVPHIGTLQFGRATRILKVDDHHYHIPLYKFNFCEYAALKKRFADNTLMIGN